MDKFVCRHQLPKLLFISYMIHLLTKFSQYKPLYVEKRENKINISTQNQEKVLSSISFLFIK